MPGGVPALVMTDQIVTPDMARALHADAVRVHVMVGWFLSEHEGKFIARMVTGSPSVYVLVAELGSPVGFELPVTYEAPQQLGED
jgi:hypothetical protein